MNSYHVGSSEVLTYSPWRIPYRARNVLCPDGIRRSARITGEADTYFSIPSSVKVRGKTVSGFLMVTHQVREKFLQDGEDVTLVFVPYQYGKNADQFPREEVWTL